MSTTLLDDAKIFASKTVDIANTIAKNKAFIKPQSIAEFSRLTQVEPITVVSADLMNQEIMVSVMQTLLSVFSGYYMQAVSLVASIDNIRIIKTLDMLNPDRDISTAILLLNKSLESNMAESYKYRLPHVISTEDDSSDYKDNSSTPFKLQDKINTPGMLAAGKLLEITFTGEMDPETSKKTKNTVTVRVTLAPVLMANDTLESMMTLKTDDNGITERYHAWRAGKIGFIKDLMFAQDLIDEHKKALMHDEDGVYSELLRRVNNGKKYGLLTQNPSLGTISSIYVISEDVQKVIEKKYGGKMNNKRILDSIFENTYGMIICVVDREWERVILYTRGISGSANYSFNEIKSIGQKNNMDIKDIMKAFVAGQPPSF